MIKAYLILRDRLKDILYYFQSRNLKKKPFPEIINLETSTLCNANCVTCPHRDIKRTINMDFTFFKKLVDEISGYNVKELHPFNYGEPFLYKDFIKALLYVRQKSSRTKIFIYSNGSAMTDSQMEKVVKDRLLDKVNFSLDAATSSTHKIMRGLDYDTTLKKIMHFIKLNKVHGSKIDITVSFVINEKNKHELKAFKNFWKGKANIHIGVDDGRDGKPFIDKASKNPCSWPFYRTIILTNGDVVICCVDAKGKLIVGNVKNKTIKEIWDSPMYEKIRQLHLSGNKNKIPLCSTCYVRY